VLDKEAFATATEVKPTFTAHADPSSQWAAARKGPAFFAYSDHSLIDTDHGIIADVAASRSVKTAEGSASRRMIDRTSDRFGLKPDWGAADTAYGCAENLAWRALDRQILLFIPVVNTSTRQDGTWSRSDVAWDPDNDRYLCLEGREPRCTRHGPTQHATANTASHVPRQQDGVPHSPRESDMLSEGRSTFRQPRAVRGGPGGCPPIYGLRVQSKGSGAPKDSREARRSPQTQSRTGSPPMTWPLWRSGRMHARSHRPEPQDIGSAQADAACGM